MSHAKTVSNASIGLNPEAPNEMNLPMATFKFLYGMKEAPKPRGTVGKCSSMRERILQMSLFPDIYDKRGKSHYYGNVDFGH